MSDLTTSLHAFAQPLKAKVAEISEKSLLYQHYPLLRKATTGPDTEDIPGYVYEELIKFSFMGEIMASQLAVYLADCLQAKSCSALKSIKVIHHLTRKGSRHFRKTLRIERDENLKLAASSSHPTVAKVSQETRILLFDEDLVAKDESNEPEAIPEPVLSGMGGGDTGFGNTPISKENLGHKVLDLWDKAVNFPDEKAEVLKSCLANPDVGEYKPVVVSPESVMSTSRIMSKSATPSTMVTSSTRKHVPGKAGGGWESSDEELQGENIVLEGLSEVSLKDDLVDSASEACEESVVSEEAVLVNDFCNRKGMPSLKELESVFEQCRELNPTNVIEQIQFILENSRDEGKLMRSMLLLEMFLRTDLLRPIVYDQLLSKTLANLKSDSKSVTVKAKKISLIVKAISKNVAKKS